MAHFCFYHCDLKKSLPPRFVSEKPISRTLQAAAMQARTTMLNSFLAFSAGDARNDALHGRLHELATTYLGWCRRLIDDGYRNCAYFYWGEVLTARKNHAFCDVYYDIANVLWNLAVADMRRASMLTTAAKDDDEIVEKSAYGLLCAAAGYLKFAAVQVAQVSEVSAEGTPTNTLIDDVSPPFLELLATLCLAEAQEVGAARALRKEIEKSSGLGAGDGLPSRLLSQVYHDYFTSYELLNGKFADDAKERCPFLLAFLELKAIAFEGLAHAYGGASKFDSQPETAMWHLNYCQEVGRTLRAYGKSRAMDKELLSISTSAETTIARVFSRYDSLNNLAVHARAVPGPLPLPIPQVLARAKVYELPASPSKGAEDSWCVVDVPKS